VNANSVAVSILPRFSNFDPDTSLGDSLTSSEAPVDSVASLTSHRPDRRPGPLTDCGSHRA